MPVSSQKLQLPFFIAFSISLVTLGQNVNAADLLAKTDQPVLGRTIIDFKLNDAYGQPHQLTDFEDAKLVVLCVLGTECPLAKLYAPRLAKLSETYKPQGVVFLGVNANRQDSPLEIQQHARTHGIKFPMLKDLHYQLIDRLGATRTPQVFVLDQQRTIRYYGRIDDQYQIGVQRPTPNREDLRIAIDELLASKPVSVAETKAVGCLIGRHHNLESQTEITFTEHIAPIMKKHCVDCHREGEIAPFALTEYEEVAGWGEMLAETIEDGRMPPWHASEEHGEFRNERRMTEQEKTLVYRWANGGTPKGEGSGVIKTEPVEDGWRLPREPDFVAHMDDRPFVVPAEGGPKGVSYKYFTVDPQFTEDKWVYASQALPGDRAVVHHILVSVVPPTRETEDFTRDNFIAAYVPGYDPRPLPHGYAKLIPAGSKLRFQMHYTPIGSVREDVSKVGFLFLDPEEVTHRVLTTAASTGGRLKIPAKADNHREEANRPLDRDVELMGLFPHMHLRGKSFLFEAQYPNGETEILLDVPNYDFNWQTGYLLKEPKLLPAGTNMHCVAYFNNSSSNPWNPNPSEVVRWGDQTWEEMMIGYFDVAIPWTPNDNRSPIMKRLDRNQNGILERDECPQKYLRVFDRLDRDDNDEVTEQELERLEAVLNAVSRR